ncbi:MAG: hypothetical protein ACRDOF_00045 [Gaiellaceae bacterium]
MRLPCWARRTLAGQAGLVACLAAGVVIIAFSGSALGHQSTRAEYEGRLAATHIPPLLTTPGEAAALRYDAYCVGGGEESESSCDVEGVAYVRPGETGPFAEISIVEDPRATEGRYVASLPDAARWSEGFSYYAVLVDRTTGATVTLPSGGAAAPQHSRPLGRAVQIDLGTHAFDATRRHDARAVQAAWGDGPRDVGLEQGRNLPPIGGSSFDVGRDGTVLVLDEANRRVLNWRKGAQAPERMPVAIAGTLADMSLAADGSLYVLESVAVPGHAPLVRRFDGYGRELEAFEIAEPTASQIRIGPDGPAALQHPSGQWMPVTEGGAPLGAAGQRSRGRAGRLHPGGREVVVLRHLNEIRIALSRANGTRLSWRVTSETPLAEVQLAEPLGNRLVLVVRVYMDDRDEFVALVLSERGLAARFSLDSADWAETAPLTRFRLVGSSLYQLGSTPTGLFVDRFDLEVN